MLIEGVSPYRAENKHIIDGQYDKKYRYIMDIVCFVSNLGSIFWVYVPHNIAYLKIRNAQVHDWVVKSATPGKVQSYSK